MGGNERFFNAFLMLVRIAELLVGFAVALATCKYGLSEFPIIPLITEVVLFEKRVDKKVVGGVERK